eukprot:756604-Hanusia_phi.AAC.1
MAERDQPGMASRFRPVCLNHAAIMLLATPSSPSSSILPCPAPLAPHPAATMSIALIWCRFQPFHVHIIDHMRSYG